MSIELMMPPNVLILCRPLLLLPPFPPSTRVFSNESALGMRWLKYWSFSFSIIPSKEHLGLISYASSAWLGSPCSPRDSQESSSTPQFKSIDSSTFSFLHSPTLTSIHVISFSFCLQSIPASGSFPVSQFCASGGQSIEVSASASVLPMNIQERKPSAEELMFLNCGVGETLESPLDCKEIQLVNHKEKQSWIFIGRTEAEAVIPILWLPDAKNWLIGEDPDAGKDWRQEENEMIEWHHWLNGHEFEQALGVGDGQGSLACCSPWGCRESGLSDWTDWLIVYLTPIFKILHCFGYGKKNFSTYHSLIHLIHIWLTGILFFLLFFYWIFNEFIKIFFWISIQLCYMLWK